MALHACKTCQAATRHLRITVRPWLITAQTCMARSSSSEAPDYDVFGQLGKPHQRQRSKTKAGQRRFLPNADQLQQHRQWEEKFGTMSPPSNSLLTEPVEGVHVEGTWNSVTDCCNEMTSLVKQGQLSRAFELLDSVCRGDEIRPNAFLYNILIGACGRAGDTKRAFKLYRQMKERGLDPDESTYTSLFNACANSPHRQEGLRQATQLYKKIQSVGWIPNTTNYHAMLKAFGRCNDLGTTFRIADEMAGAGHLLDARVLESLLSACITDKENGLHHALQVWRRFRHKRIPASLHSYHLFLRVLKECRAGSQPLPAEQLRIGSSSMPKDTQTTSVVVAVPDLETPEARLAAIGGVDVFLSELLNDQLRPDVRTFTDLLVLLPNSSAAETTLFSTMEQYGVKPDTSLFNALIKRRNFRGDCSLALDTLSQMQEKALVPDIMTFGVLALGCHSKQYAQRLLKDMQVAGFRPNVEIFGALLKNACWRSNWPFACEVLAQMQEHKILPNARILQRLEKSIARTKDILISKEKGKSVPGRFTNPEYVDEFKLFLTVYKGWLQVTPVSPESIQQHRRDRAETTS